MRFTAFRRLSLEQTIEHRDFCTVFKKFTRVVTISSCSANSKNSMFTHEECSSIGTCLRNAFSYHFCKFSGTWSPHGNLWYRTQLEASRFGQ